MKCNRMLDFGLLCSILNKLNLTGFAILIVLVRGKNRINVCSSVAALISFEFHCYQGWGHCFCCFVFLRAATSPKVDSQCSSTMEPG